ncbi:MAG TPA: DUF5916 domain-containing protein, partial [Thermoanaerobaculia bacterium]|nr:DUF5916 domain-containing protein [Thermoanaerobaculia bacterium]
MRRLRRLGFLSLAAPALVLSLALTPPLAANGPTVGPEIHVTRATSAIEVDGDLSDPAWKDAKPVDVWFETNPGDNLPAKIRNVGRLTYDDRFLYAAFEFDDPNPAKIRAPFSDRDNVSGDTDYGGIIVDTRHDGRTGILLLANPRGVQYDAVSDDTNGNEDSSPDLFWDSAARITPTGWTLEMRVPFSSLRYPKGDPQTWGIILYRNWPRDFRYQFFAQKLPRNENCFICHGSPLTGLEGLPKGGHLVAAPYVSAEEMGVPRGDLGTPLVNKPVDVTGGLDVKWTPNENMAVDATIHPDFSQVESDVAQISANERFALFFPEKRPFFLESVDLYATPLQAVYTRSIADPKWGARGTGRLG